MDDWLTDKIDCDDGCEIPPGHALSRVPTPRHVWADIMQCPNCGDCFLIKPRDLAPPEPSA